MKTCCRCGESKPDDEFYRNRSKQDGLSSDCKVCALGRTKDWQERLKDDIGEDAFRERNRQAVEKYRARPENRERNKRNSRAYSTALRALRDRYRVEFETLLDEERRKADSE